MAAMTGHHHGIQSALNVRFSPQVDFSRCGVTGLATAAATGRSRALFYLAFLYPDIEHATDGIGIGIEVQCDIAERALTTLFEVITYLGQYHGYTFLIIPPRSHRVFFRSRYEPIAVNRR